GMLPGGEKNPVFWSEKAGRVTKEEFFQYLVHHSEKFVSVERCPHHPKVPGAYYLRDEVPGGSGKYLEAFLDFFSPSGRRDRELMRAFILTPFWGGPPGKRPNFVITSKDGDAKGGRGVGKTTFALLVGDLAGGKVLFQKGEDGERFIKRLISAGAR